MASFGNVPEVFAEGFIFTGCLAALLREAPEGDVFKLASSVNGVCGRALLGHGAALRFEIDGRRLRGSLVCLVRCETVLILGIWRG